MDQSRIRNFCIIAHIDHGKSTLADRLLELTGTVEKRNMKAQLLDRMDLEREKGITIKLAPVRMIYTQTAHSKYETLNAKQIQNSNIQNAKSGSLGFRDSSLGLANSTYELNLIDTPGHVDFSYEVSRSLQACEGALLVVDASQGIQAQTLANVYLAMAADLTIIPVLNKIDLPAADVPKVSREVMSLLGCEQEDIVLISAKTGEGVETVLDAILSKVPPPSGEVDHPTRALIFDSYYDDYRGVILYVRVVDGQIGKNDEIRMLATGVNSLALEVGRLAPDMQSEAALKTGEIGYIVTNLKTTRDAKVGDTVTLKRYVEGV